jgi:hypothetical protein
MRCFCLAFALNARRRELLSLQLGGRRKLQIGRALIL